MENIDSLKSTIFPKGKPLPAQLKNFSLVNVTLKCSFLSNLPQVVRLAT